MSSTENSPNVASDAALLSEKTFEARRNLLSRVAKREAANPIKASPDSSLEASEFDISPDLGFSSSMQSSVFNAQSDRHLLSSLSSARGSIVALETANKDLLDALSSRHAELERANSECTEWHNKYTLQLDRFQAVERTCAELRAALTTSESQKAKVIAEKDIIEGKFQYSEQGRLENQKNLTETRVRLSTSESELSALKTQIPNLQREIDRLTEVVTSKDHIIDSRDNDLKDARLKIEELLERLAKLQVQVSLAERESALHSKEGWDALEKALAALAAEKTANDLFLEDDRAMRKKLDLMTAELMEGKKVQASGASELNSLRQQVSVLLGDNNALHADLNGRDELLKVKDKEIKDAQQKLDDVCAQLAQALASLKKLEGNNASEADLLAAKKRLSLLEAELSKLKMDHLALQDENAKISGLYAGLQSKFDNLTLRHTALSAEYASCGDELDRLKGDLIHTKEDANFKIVDLRKLLEEALCALAYEKTANDLMMEEEAGIRRQMTDLMNQTQRAAAEVEHLTSEMASTKAHNSELEKDIGALRQKLTDRDELLRKDEGRIAELQREIEKLTAQLDKSNKDLATATVNLKTKDSNHSDALKIISEMKKDMSRLHDELQKALDELARLKAERDSLHKSYLGSSSDVTTLRAKIAELERLVDGLSRSLSDKDETFKQRELELKECRIKIDVLTTELSMLRDQVSTFQDESFSSSDMKASKDRITDLESELERVKALYQSVSDRHRNLEQEHTSLGNSNDKLQGLLLKLEAESSGNLDELNRNLKDALSNLATEKAKLDKYIQLHDASQRDLEASQDELAKTKGTASNSLAEIARLKKIIDSLEKELDALKTVVKDKDSVISKKDIDLAASSRSYEKASSQLAKVEANLTALDESLKKNAAAFDTVSKKLTTTESELTDTRNGLTKALDDLSQANAQNNRLKSLEATLESEIKALNEKLVAFQQELAAKMKSEETLLGENLSLRKDIKKISDTSAKLESKNDMLESRLKTVEVDLNSAMSNLATKDKELTKVDAERVDFKARYASLLERSGAIEKDKAALSDLTETFKGQVASMKYEADEISADAKKTVDESRRKIEAQSLQLNKFADELMITKRAQFTAEEALASARDDLSQKAAELANLKRALESSKVEIDQLRQNLADTQILCDTKNKELLESHHAVSSLTVEIENCRHSLEVSERGRTAAVDDVSSINRRVEALNIECKKLSSSVGAKDKIILDLEAEIKALKEEVNIKDSRIESGVTTITLHEQEITQLKGSLAKATVEASEAQRTFKSDVDIITKKLADESAALNVQATRLAVAQESILDLKKSNEGLVGDIKHLEQKLVMKDQDILGGRESLVKCESELKVSNNALKTLKEKASELTGVNEQLKAQMADISSRMAETEKESFTKDSIIDDLRTTIAREAASAEVKLGDMKGALEAALRELKAEKATVDLLTEKLNAIESEGGVFDLEEKLKAASNSLKLSAAELALKSGNIDQYEHQVKVLLSESKRKDKLIMDLETALTDSNKKVSELSAAASKLKDDLSSSRQHADSLKNEFRKSQDDCASAKSELAKVNDALAALKDKFTASQSSVNTLESRHAGQIDRLQKQDKELLAKSEEIDYIKGQLSLQYTNSERKHAEASNMLSEVLHALAAEKTANDLLLADLQASQMSAFILDDDLQAARNELIIRSSELSSLMSLNGDLRKQVESLSLAVKLNEELVRDRDVSLAEKQRAIDSLSSLPKQLEQQIASLKDSLSGKDSEVAAAKTRVSMIQTERDGLNGELHGALDELAQVKAEISILQMSLASKELEHKKLVDDHRALNDLQEETSRVIATRESSLVDAQSMIENLTTRRSKMQQEISELDKSRKASEESYKSATTSLSSKTKECVTALATVSELEARLKNLTARMKFLETENSNLGKTIDEIRGDLAAGQQGSLKEIEDLKNIVQQLNATLAAELTSKQSISAALVESKTAGALLETKLQHKIDENRDLTRTVTEKTSNIAQLEIQLAELKMAIKNVESMLSIKTTELSEVARNAEKLTSKITKIEKDLERSEEQSAVKDTNLTSALKKISDLEADSDRLHSRLHVALDNEAKERAELAHVTSRLTAANEGWKQAQDAVDRFNLDFSTLKQERDKLFTDNKNLLKDIASADDARKVSESNLNACRERMAALDAELLKMKELLAAKDKESASALAETRRYAAQLTSQGDRLKALNSSSGAGSEVDDLKSQLAHTIAESNAKITELQNTGDGLRSELDAVNASHKNLSSDNVSLREKLSSCENALAVATNEAATRTAEVKAFAEKISSLEGEVEELRASLVDTKKQLTSKTVELHDVEHAKNVLSHDFESQKIELKTSEEAKSGLQIELSTARETITDLETSLGKLRNQLSDTQKSSSSTNAEIDSLRAQLASQSDRLKDSVRLLTDKEKELADLKKKVEAADKENRLELESVKNALSTAQRALVEEKTESEQLGVELKSAKDFILRGEDENARLKMDLSGKTADLTNAKADFKALTAELETARAALAEKDKAYHLSQNDLKSTISNLEKAEKELERLRDASAVTERSRQQLEGALAAERSKFSEAQDRLHDSHLVKSNTAANLKNLEKDLLAANQRIEKLESDNAALAKDLEMEKASKPSPSSGFSFFQSESADVEALKKELNDTKAKLLYAESKLRDSEKELSDLADQFAFKMSDFVKTSDESAENLAKLQLMAEKLKEKEKACTDREEDIEEIKLMLSDAVQAGAKANREITNLTEKEAKLKLKLDEAAMMVTELQNQIDDVKGQNDAERALLEGKLKRLEDEYSEFKALSEKATNDGDSAYKARADQLEVLLVDRNKELDALNADLLANKNRLKSLEDGLDSANRAKAQAEKYAADTLAKMNETPQKITPTSPPAPASGTSSTLVTPQKSNGDSNTASVAPSASKTYVNAEELEIKLERKTPMKVAKGSSPPFNVDNIDPKDLPKYTAAAVRIQAHARGMFARSKTRKMLKSIPHVLNLQIDFCEDMPSNNDFMHSKPDVYVLVNTFRKVGRQQKCHSTAKTRVIVSNTSPVFEEDLRLSVVGQGLVVVNVMSKHTLGADTIIGQAVIDIDKHRNLYTGEMMNMRLAVKDAKVPVHDTSGKLLSLGPATPKGFISLSVSIPSIYENMCGWFYNITTDFLGGTSGEKMWVVLNDKVLYCYSTPFDSVVKYRVNCSDINDIVESTYDKLEISVQGLIIKIIDSSGYKSDLMWAWGDDAGKVKGIWRRALVRHYNRSSSSPSK